MRTRVTPVVSRSRLLLPVVAGAVVAAVLSPAQASTSRAVVVSGVAGHVAGKTTAGTKVKVDFVVTNHAGAKSAAQTATLALVGGGHSYSLGTATVPALKQGASKPISVTNLPSPKTTTGDYVVRVCLPPRPAGPCAESGSVTVHIAPPALTAPKSVTLPTTLLGKTSAATAVTVTNTGQSVTGLIDLTIGGPDATAFALSTRGCHVSLSPGKACSPTLVFTPQHSGVSTATMTLTGAQGARTTATVTLTGTGTSPTVLVTNPTSFAFPDTPVGQTASTPIKVTNTSNAVTGTIKAALSGAGAGQYTADTNGCAAALPAGGSCTIQVQFHPTVAGDAPATLTVAADPGGTATTTLTGRTPPAPGSTLAFNPATYDYGSVNLGTKVSNPFTLTNNSTTATGAQTLTISGPQATSYSLDPGTCQAGLAPGASCTATVSFNPSNGGANQATLTATPTTGSATSATLNGNGTGLTFVPASHDYGPHALGSTTTFTFTAQNNTALNITIGAISLTEPNGFQYMFGTNNCGSSLPPNGSCTFQIQFKPTATGGSTAALSVFGDHNLFANGNVTGTGT